MKKYFILIILFFLISSLFPNLILAEDCPEGSVCMLPPTKHKTFEDLINGIVNYLFIIAIPVASIMVIVASYHFITAVGDPEKIKTAKKIILYTLIGLAIIAFAKGVTSIIKYVFSIK